MSIIKDYREGNLDAPERHPIDWKSEEFYDEEALDAEMRRAFDICHGCRRCFNLCDSFPRLFDLVDASPSGELDTVDSKDFKPVVDACTLCDMCFLTKCPYVPPHEFNLDFPHLMLRYRAVERRKGEKDVAVEQLTETDRNGSLAALAAPIANWASKTENKLTRPVLEKVTGVDQNASLPKYNGKTFVMRAKETPPQVNTAAPAYGQRKAIIYATCFANYNNPTIGQAAQAVLALNGVETKVVYPECCGMPQLEQGNIERVAEKAQRVATELVPYINDGWDIIAPVPSCALMLKFEWPLISPESIMVNALSKGTQDITEYVVHLAKEFGGLVQDGLTTVEGGVALHLACHARAQNMGAKGAEMLRLIPKTRVSVVERCSGHGGSWGVMKDNFDTALKVGKPAADRVKKSKRPHLASECPLAGEHLRQILEIDDSETTIETSRHPIEILAAAYGFDFGSSPEGH